MIDFHVFGTSVMHGELVFHSHLTTGWLTAQLVGGGIQMFSVLSCDPGKAGDTKINT